MKALRFTLCLLLCGALISCSSVAVKSDFDANANFAQYKTFDFMPHRIPFAGQSIE